MKHSSYRDRADAGRALLSELDGYRGCPGLLVIGLARGGVPVAAEVAAGLGADLDVAVVRKLGAPGQEELALGAISASRIVMNDELVRSLAISQSTIDAIVRAEQIELARREDAYRGGRAPIELAGRTVIVVDDGIATGASMRVAVLDVRGRGAQRVVIAVPAAPMRARDQFADIADEFVCPCMPRRFVAVGMCYANFTQTSDQEVCALLARSN